MQDEPILITGCARSGTSLVAGIIELCGAFGGKTSGPNKYNTKGMFENAVIRDKIVKPYLKKCGFDPLCQYPLPTLDGLEPEKQWSHTVNHVIVMEGYIDGPWYYKGAKMALMWPIWNESYPNAKWIIVRRNTDNIIQSCLRTPFMQKLKTYENWKIWVEIHLQRFQEMKYVLQYHEVWSDEIVAGNLSGIRTVIEDYGLTWNDTTIKDFIEPEMFHE